MKVSFRQFNILAIVLGVLALFMLPFWPYSHWGYFPSILLVVMVAVMFAFRRIAQN